MADQGQPIDQLNVDELMSMKMAELKQYLEPYAAEHFGTGEMALVSLAISAKRVADNQQHVHHMLSQLLTGINSLCTLTQQGSNIRHDDFQLIKSALYTLDSTIAGSQRDLRITVSKE